jgi:2,3-bisphosphoglycerate-dependent phosphoglycerate mutase
MAKLFLLRHLESQWNEEEKRFTGWVDTPLKEGQEKRARELAGKIFKEKISVIYCSSLFRNMDTVARIFEYNKKYPIFIHEDKGKTRKWEHFKDISAYDVSVYVSDKLNERYYGKLQGINKDQAIKKYGAEKVHLWRRDYNGAPPGGESLKDVVRRVAPFYKKHIEKEIKKGDNVLVVASHNALRALIMYIEKIPKDKIIDLELPFGALIEYDFDKSLKIKGKKIT